MTHYTSDAFHQPKGDHNRRLSLGLEPEQFAAEAGISTEQLRDYERTAPDHDYDPHVAQRISETLDRLERSLPNLQTGRSDLPGHNAPQPDHSRHARLMPQELVPSVLEGAIIYGTGNRELGTVSHVQGSGPAAEVVVDVGGFLGIGAKPVALPAAQLDFMRDENGRVHALTEWSEAELKAFPEYRRH